LAQERGPTAGRGDETHLLAVRLGRRSQPELGSPGSHLGLGQVTDRKQDTTELVLAQYRKDVGLVLGPVRTATKAPAPPLVHDARVVARGHGVEAQLDRPIEEAPELEVPVALDAGVGS